MQNYDIFLVDADNTLLDFHKSSVLAICGAFESLGLECPDEYLQKYSVFNESLWQRLERKELTREELMKNRFIWFLQELGLTQIDGAEFNQKYIEALSTRPVFIDGAEEFMQKLREKGRLYIVTNGTEYIQKSRFDILDLWNKVDGVFISQTAGADKPDKKFTDYVLARIKDFSIDRAVWIGDSLSADIRAANDANIASIGYNPEKTMLAENAPTPTYIAENFQKILSILGIN